MIKKYWKKIGFFIFGSVLFFGNLAFAQEFDVTNYEVNANIRIDGTIDVNEKIDVNFYEHMHGIERFFEKYYSTNDMRFQTIYNNIEVIGDNYQNFDEYNEIYTRIGDANKTIIGEHQYNIDYSAYGLIRNFSGMGYSELYWTVIGYEWGNNINKVKIKISLPKSYTGFTKDDFIISAGYSYEGNENFGGEISWDENNIYITYDKNLSPYEGITLAVKFPNNYFEYDHEKQASLFVGYTHNYKIQNYKLKGTVSKTGNIVFNSDIDLKILNEGASISGRLPFKYKYDYRYYMTKLGTLNVNGNEFKTEEYDTTNMNQIFYFGDLSGQTNISADYSVYGLIRLFSGEDEDLAYRLYLPLPIFDTYEEVNNFELELDFPQSDFPNFCSGIYKEYVNFIIYESGYNLDDFYNEGGSLWCEDNKLSMIYNNALEPKEVMMTVDLEKGLFDLDEDLLGALDEVGNGEFYYGNKINTPSLIFLAGMLILGGSFGTLMMRRYKKNSKNDKYIVQYDAPEGVEPPEAGILIDDKLDPKDITSLIYRWASNRYIKICAEDDTNKKFYIKKLKDLPQSAKEYQKNLFKKLFSSGKDFYFSINKNKFSTYISQTEKDLKSYINGEKRYKCDFGKVPLNTFSFKSGTKSRIFWVAVLWGIVYCSAMVGINSTLNSVRSGMVPIFWIGLIGIICTYRKKEKEQGTEKGIEFRQHCLGFKEFLNKVDKKKIEELTKQDPLFVEKSLPYAVVFGIETDFIKKITPEMLSWYDGGDVNNLLSSVNYIRSVTTIPSYHSYGGYSNSGSSYSYSSSSGHSSGSSFSSGGFSSGGGGGGGGGRGW